MAMNPAYYESAINSFYGQNGGRISRPSDFNDRNHHSYYPPKQQVVVFTPYGIVTQPVVTQPVVTQTAIWTPNGPVSVTQYPTITRPW